MNKLLLLFTFLPFICVGNINSQKSKGVTKLWYKTPADALTLEKPKGWTDDNCWLKALPIGNGYMGAMVYGDVFTEKIQLNNKTLWSGSPQDTDNPVALEARAEIRSLLLAGKYKEAENIAVRTQICKGEGSNRANAANKPFGCYQTLGNLYIDFDEREAYTDYRRELDMERGLVNVSYKVNGNKITRTYFASYPDRAIIVKMVSDRKGGLNFSVRMDRPERFEVLEDAGQLVMKGVLDNGKGGEGMKYWARLDASLTGGKKTVANGQLNVKGADEVVLYLTSATNYVGYPTYLDAQFKENTAEVLEKAMGKSYRKAEDIHIKDHSCYFNRMAFRLTENLIDTIPTDVRLEKVRKGATDLHLQELLFQYGRYLLIASSRQGTLPANLQGVWCDKIQSAWNCDYHMDINLQMNYWLAQVANLPELFMPYVDFMESIQEPGKKTAKIHYNSAGWCIHPIVNVWGFTSPGEGVHWGSHIGATGWICQNMWEQYAFTQNEAYLKRIYPILKNTALFYTDWLYRNPVTNKWISIPSISPENQFVIATGEKFSLCAGTAHDHQVIRDLFLNFIAASRVLNVDDDLVRRVEQMLPDLQESEIGPDGRLLEWDQAYKEADPGHRHMSHLYALHPASRITKETPELFRAARKSLDKRIEYMRGTVAWSVAWMSCCGARLGDAELAYSSVEKLLEKCVLDNFFTLGPPFQIEAGFGITAGMSEMLVQSHTGKITLLPALPLEWPDGNVKGICARGGYELSLDWKDGKLRKMKIVSKVKKGDVTLVYNGREQNVYLKKGEAKEVRFDEGM